MTPSDDRRGIVCDNFAGGGGASTGIEAALGRPCDYAINHDAEAIAMHRANHPTTTHLQTSVWDVNPCKLCRGREVSLGWFSPDCTFHSKARGVKRPQTFPIEFEWNPPKGSKQLPAARCWNRHFWYGDGEPATEASVIVRRSDFNALVRAARRGRRRA
jgi:hypothetical protein